MCMSKSKEQFVMPAKLENDVNNERHIITLYLLTLEVLKPLLAVRLPSRRGH